MHSKNDTNIVWFKPENRIPVSAVGKQLSA